MLRLVLGRAGSGKTQAIVEKLRSLLQAQGRAARCIWLVPEQFSFETERTVLQELGPQASACIKVYSFTRLAEMVAAELGGVAGRTMNEATRVLLMSEAMLQVAERLKLYRPRGKNEAQIRAMLRFVQECKQGGISPVLLEETAHKVEGTLQTKLRDLSLVMGAYEALCAQSYVDPQDALAKLYDRLPQSRLVRGTTVFVDGFKGFTAEELRTLGGLMSVAEEVTVTLCADTLQAEDTTHLFYVPMRTAAQLMRTAKERQVPVGEVQYLTENHRHSTEGLRHLEGSVLRGEKVPYEQAADDVTVTEYGNIYRECEGTVRTIRRRMREGIRCRDMAIAVRSLPEYQGILDVLLEEAHIPYYMDTRQNIQSDTLTITILSALRCVLNSFCTEDVLRLVKTGLLGFSAHSIALMENYVYLWNIQGSGWKREWKRHPEGFSTQMDKGTERRLAYLERLRHRVIDPLVRLQQALEKPCTGKEFARAMYRYLLETHADRMVRLQVARLESAGEMELADRTDRLWDTTMELLDTFAAALGTSKGSADHFAELFHRVAEVTDLGSIPQQMDAVQIGSVERMRFSAPEVVFVLGANEGKFPAVPNEDGVLSDRERRTLRDLELPLAEAVEGQIAEERFFIYTALAAPSRELYVSYTVGSITGEVQTPSVMVEEIRELLPYHRRGEDTRADGEDLEYGEEMVTRLAEGYRRPDTVTATIREVLQSDPAWQDRVQRVEQAAQRREWKFRSPEVATELFGKNLTLSATKVETFYHCRFQYFCKNGMRVSRLRQADLGTLEFGTVLHDLMQRQLPEYVKAGFATVTREQVRQDASQRIDEYIQENMGGMAEKNERFWYLVSRLKRIGDSVLWYVVRELSQNVFVPVDYELPITDRAGQDGLSAKVLEISDGSRVCVVGKIDRVDVYRKGDVAYVRVVDYKSGKKEFRLNEVVEGLNLQMLIYMNTIWENGGPRYGAVSPAGMLYLPSKLPIFNVKRTEDEKQSDQEQLKSIKMNGLWIDNEEILQDMIAHIDGAFIPFKKNKEGKISHTHLASLQQMGRLKQRAEQLLSDMVLALHQGEIEAVPIRLDKKQEKSACRYCDYCEVCGYEEGERVRSISDESTWQILKDRDEEIS